MKLIQTQDYLLFINEKTEIKEYFEGYVYQPHWKKPVQLEDNFISLGYAEEDRKDFGGGRIIAYRKLNKEAKELDLPLLPNPFEEVDIEELACKKYDIKLGINDYDERYYNSHNVAKAEAFIEGYETAQSKQLELLKRAIQLASDAENIEEVTEEIIQSLSTQQLPKEFIPEYTWEWFDSVNDTGWENISPSDMDAIIAHGLEPQPKFRKRLKTITNSEGKQELIGSYKY